MPAVSAARIAGGGVAVAREESGRWGMTGGSGLSVKGGEEPGDARAQAGGGWRVEPGCSGACGAEAGTR